MIWIIGSGGMLGRELCEVLPSRGPAPVTSDRGVDILDPAALEAFAGAKGIRWAVNCAAYTAVDKAEGEEALARRVNAEGARNVARLCRAIGARLLHISTDYVFDGKGDRPYLETDPVGPTGAYGRTKAEGERLVMSEAPDSVIFRTAWLYGRHGPNFVGTMLRLMAERDEVGVVADQSGSPTWTFDLATAIADTVSAEHFPGGIYHYSGEGETTWYEFAREVQRLGREFGVLGRDCAVKALATSEYPTKAARPSYSVLCKDKARGAGLSAPDWRTSLRAYFLRDVVPGGA